MPLSMFTILGSVFPHMDYLGQTEKNPALRDMIHMQGKELNHFCTEG